MARRAHAEPRYESLGIELHEVSRSTSASQTELGARGLSSHASSLTGVPRADNDEQSSMLLQKSTATEHVLEVVDDTGKHTPPSRKRCSRFKSWKVGVTINAAMTTTVLLVNIILTVWASVSFGLEGGIGTAHSGDCETVSAWSFWLHILINGLSSILLSASNYSMQCVTAPTRRECDLAHLRGDWLDIGILSIRNLFKISWQRSIMWALLAFSSTPIHFLYNSAVFKTLDNNDYTAMIVGRKFLQDDYVLPTKDDIEAAVSRHSRYNLDNVVVETYNGLMMTHEKYVANASSFTKLLPDQCIEAYATYYLSGHGDVLLITDDTEVDTFPGITGTSGGSIDGRVINIPFDWMCPEDLNSCRNPAEAKNLATDWTLSGLKIEYCLSENIPPRCKFQFSTYILVAVILCNATKSAVMLSMVWRQRETTFVTFGDAVASWLDNPDRSTVNRCSESAFIVVHDPMRLLPAPRTIDRSARRWWLGISKRRWIVTISCLSIALVVGCVCLAATLAQMKRDTADTMMSLGFGEVNSNMLLMANLPERGIAELISAVLFANLPQVVLSFVYLSFNALVTSSMLVNDYSSYEVQRKSLRVTTPRGQQRSTYWLQIPFTYGIPIIAVSATLHWLISQAVFLVRVEYDSIESSKYSNSVSAVGLSPAPMMIVLVLGGSPTTIAIAMSFIKLKGTSMPVAASCSRAIAAAAHRPVEDVDTAVLPVQWGEVEVMGNADVGHCCFTSREVLAVDPRKKYA